VAPAAENGAEGKGRRHPDGEKRHLSVGSAPFRAVSEQPRCAAAFDLKLPQLAKHSRSGIDGFRAGFPVFAKSSV
jgi:hypothetical protein